MIMDVLQFVFQDFWHWLGMCLIVSAFRLFSIKVEKE